MGDLAQCRGVARALTGLSGFEKWQVMEKTVTPAPWHRLPMAALPVIGHEDLYASPPPKLIIASGRRTLPFLRRFHRQFGQDRPFIAYLKNPAHGTKWLDFIWAPHHDGHHDAFDCQTVLSPHSHDAIALQKARTIGLERFAAHPEPFHSIILGGNSKAVTWDAVSATAFADKINALPEGGTILITPSRRTPAVLLDALTQAVAARPHWLWDGEGDNPYPAMLAISQTILMTGDSHNMVSEALASQARLIIHRPPGLAPKLVRFLDEVEAQGWLDEGREPVNETPLIAAALAKAVTA